MSEIKVGERVRMSCIYNDRDVVVLALDTKEATVRFEDTGQDVVVPLSVLYT
jgi:hypothetical protein